MGRTISRWAAVSAVLASFGLASCGTQTTGSNDQGIVFQAVGIVRGPEQITEQQIQCTEPTTENAIADTSHNLDITFAREYPDRGDPFGNPCGGYIGLLNHLATLAINVTEIVITYEIPGAGIPLPSNSVATGQRINPSTSDDDASSGQTNLLYIQLAGQIVPSSMIVFLNQNVNRLPQTPYTMNVFFVAKGQSENGTRYESNQIGYTLTITQ